VINNPVAAGENSRTHKKSGGARRREVARLSISG